MHDPLEVLCRQWPHARINENFERTAVTANRLFSTSKNARTPISLWVRGTNFQVSVWRALLNIQFGRVASYGQIARAIGKPAASRAVGTAIGANPIGMIIPCHRVLRGDGELGGYRWGQTRKHAMLARETALSE
jgi:AraC family transcriptional regulator of adaptative response/methylated-DNA-[protein]-cysteine methyltransferase